MGLRKLNHYSLIQDTKLSLHGCCPGTVQVFETVPCQVALPCLCEVQCLRSLLVSPDPFQLLSDGVGGTSLSIPAEQNGHKASVTWWLW